MVEAAQVTAELLAGRLCLSREEYVALGVYVARLWHLHEASGWEE